MVNNGRGCGRGTMGGLEAGFFVMERSGLQRRGQVYFCLPILSCRSSELSTNAAFFSESTRPPLFNMTNVLEDSEAFQLSRREIKKS